MGGRSYMVATRMPMTRAAFDEWLTTPLPGLDAIANPAEMWTGWFLDGEVPDWEPEAPAYRAERASTPQRVLAQRASGGYTVARHRDGMLECYLYEYHRDVWQTQTELLMFAGAGRFADAEAPVMHWGGEVYPDLPLGSDVPLSVLLAGPSGARFVASYPLDELLATLRPVEAAFLGATDEEGAWYPDGTIDPAVG
ncbi:hypothetical protein KZZ52_22520 [Dactylosporangium sp. AC04546]|uniref:hypothetical protein n=1 Tax=Dactylosporangium sp. AC04546 TaxID=2862460 RepID=UPI001EDDC68B|nr:hypothetical protein [Dactylosporangium sp. AC04546]WVK88055.1 hypothetical protein KZZ52_22520 [Dactylosporangium sp. AC04546]